MGAFQIWQIEFKDKQSRKEFEKLKLHRRVLCVYDNLKDGFTLDVSYFMGFDGYAFGGEFLNKNQKLNIKKFYSLDLSNRTNWYNELKNYCEDE